MITNTKTKKLRLNAWRRRTGDMEIIQDKSLIDTLRNQYGKVHEISTSDQSLKPAAIFACKCLTFHLL